MEDYAIYKICWWFYMRTCFTKTQQKKMLWDGRDKGVGEHLKDAWIIINKHLFICI